MDNPFLSFYIHSGHIPGHFRSEKRRVGEEGRSWWAPDHLKKKKKQLDVELYPRAILHQPCQRFSSQVHASALPWIPLPPLHLCLLCPCALNLPARRLYSPVFS